jgi:Mrp family chromosome partitioning ATPase/capsular polysaccharide biosynthesis protein
MLNTDPIDPLSYQAPRGPRDPHDRDAFDGDAVIRFVHRRGRVVVFWLMAGLLTGITYTMLTPRYYTAIANILLDEQAARPVDAVGNGTDATNTSYLETQVQVLESNEVLGHVVDTNRLAEDGEFGRSSGGLLTLLSQAVRSLLGYGTAPAEPRYATIVRVRRELSVLRLGMSNVLEIRFTSRSPVRSAEFANAIIHSYIDGRLMVQRKQHEEAASLLWARLAELRDKAFPVDSPQDGLAAASDSRPQARARFREQQDQTQAYRELYDRLLQRAYSDSPEQLSSADVLIITPAEPPLMANSIMTFVLAFTCIGGVAGFGHALLKHMKDHGLTTIEDVQRSTGIDRAAAVPNVKLQAWTTKDPLPGYLQPVYLSVSPLVHEAMARLAVRLQDGQNHRRGWIVGIAGPTDGTGVSTIAAHLARTIAESGQKTLLVDANWQKPTPDHVFLNASESRTLAKRLATIRLGPESLDILVLRATTPISELNASLSIVSTLETLRLEYDYIVVDFHSAEQTADFEAAKTATDQVVVVAEARRTASGSLCSFLQEIPSNRTAAIILNKLQSRASSERHDLTCQPVKRFSRKPGPAVDFGQPDRQIDQPAGRS